MPKMKKVVLAVLSLLTATFCALGAAGCDDESSSSTSSSSATESSSTASENDEDSEDERVADETAWRAAFDFDMTGNCTVTQVSERNGESASGVTYIDGKKAKQIQPSGEMYITETTDGIYTLKMENGVEGDWEKHSSWQTWEDWFNISPILEFCLNGYAGFAYDTEKEGYVKNVTEEEYDQICYNTVVLRLADGKVHCIELEDYDPDTQYKQTQTIIFGGVEVTLPEFNENSLTR